MRLDYKNLNGRGGGFLLPNDMDQAVARMKQLNRKSYVCSAVLTDYMNKWIWDQSKKEFIPVVM